VKSGCTPSQTVGPFFHFALTPNASPGCLAGPEARGERLRLRFRVFDGDGAPVPDAMIELWQADSGGRYRHPEDSRAPSADPAFAGFGRLATDASGGCTFETVRPGPVPDGRGGCQSPHINVAVFARGLLSHLCTRVYFAGDPTLGQDPILSLAPEERRGTLLAHPAPGEPGLWLFDVRLQGEGETVFFDL
jgi:protocatechuate 3,4-dioxygenase alpha subunit